ncbi:MAG: hypothetical protein HC855_10820, partial [Rhizobiales bacterium]|nr:hypothetical protein [Hyphomicrobiales bacterium]
MAEEKEDPRETPWHPRHAQHIRGHKQARDTISAAFASGKAHHAWLFAGPRGVGKSTLAYALARGILSGLPPAEYFAHEPVGQHAKWIAAKAHPDLKVLERRWDDKKLKTEIVVDGARELGAFLSLTSGGGTWRIVIVDAGVIELKRTIERGFEPTRLCPAAGCSDLERTADNQYQSRRQHCDRCGKSREDQLNRRGPHEPSDRHNLGCGI